MSRAQLGPAIPHRYVFELRYELGELYWDRSGRIARKLAAKKGWALKSVDVNGTHICDEEQNLVFNYSATKLDLTQAQNREVKDLLPPDQFAAIAEEFAAVIVDVLEVKTYPRIGFRLWTLYGMDSTELASQYVAEMPFFSPSKAIMELGKLSHPSHGVVIERPDCDIRVAVVPFEQDVRLAPSLIADAKIEPHRQSKDQRKLLIQKLKAKRAIGAYPATGVMSDMDAFIEDPLYPDPISPIGFVNLAMGEFEKIRKAIFSEVKP
jgi:hypothetical protein